MKIELGKKYRCIHSGSSGFVEGHVYKTAKKEHWYVPRIVGGYGHSSHGLVSKFELVEEVDVSTPEPKSARDQVGGTHYSGRGGVEPVEFITSNGMSFLEGCVIKRVYRHKNKNKAEDIRKAIQELELILELEYGTNDK